MASGEQKISRKGDIPKPVLRSLRESYALANRQASELTRAYRNNPLALIDLQGEIERGADRASAVALRAQTAAVASGRRSQIYPQGGTGCR